MSEPRPAGVPPEATYDATAKEWVLGTKDDDGNRHGTWRYWAERGYLLCQSEFAAGKLRTYRRFHPDGEPAESGRVDDRGRIVDQSWGLTTGETPETLPSIVYPVPPNTKTIVKVTNSMPVRVEHLDARGRRLDAFGNVADDATDAKARCLAFIEHAAESAAAACERYRSFFRALVQAKGVGEDHELLAPHVLMAHGPPATREELDGLEARLGLRLPPSYVAFVTSQGFVGFGRDEARMFTPDAVVRLRSWLEDAEYDDAYLEDNFDIAAEDALLTERSIGFSQGDAKGQIVAMYCFRYDDVDAATGEPRVHPFDHEDPTPFTRAPAADARGTFDAHVSLLVDEKIRAVVDDLLS